MSLYEIMRKNYREKYETIKKSYNNIEELSIHGANFIEEITPKKFAISQGVIYDFIKSSELPQVVITNNFDYPNFAYNKNSIILAEAVVAALYFGNIVDNEDLYQVLLNCEKTKRLIRDPNIPPYTDTLNSNGIFTIPGIPYISIIGKSNNLILPETIKSNTDLVYNIDFNWPDLSLILDRDMIIYKKYDYQEGTGILSFLTAKEDSLLLFLRHYLALLEEQLSLPESANSIIKYIQLSIESINEIGNIPYQIKIV